jgi:hypothetical protein
MTAILTCPFCSKVNETPYLSTTIKCTNCKQEFNDETAGHVIWRFD